MGASSLGFVDELLSVGWGGVGSCWSCRSLVLSVVVGVDWLRGGVGDHLLQVMASWTRQPDRAGGVPHGRQTWARFPRHRNLRGCAIVRAVAVPLMGHA